MFADNTGGTGTMITGVPKDVSNGGGTTRRRWIKWRRRSSNEPCATPSSLSPPAGSTRSVGRFSHMHKLMRVVYNKGGWHLNIFSFHRCGPQPPHRERFACITAFIISFSWRDKRNWYSLIWCRDELCRMSFNYKLRSHYGQYMWRPH